MATASKTNTLTELEDLEAAATKAIAEANQTSRELEDAHGRLRALLEERNRLVQRQPDLIDHHGTPLDDNNEVGKVDAAIADLPDIDDLNARATHTRKLERFARQKVEDHIAANFPALVEAFKPQAEEVTARLTGALSDALLVAEQYLGTFNRSVGLTAPVQGVDGRCVPGLDSVSELLRLLRDFTELPAPYPRVNR